MAKKSTQKTAVDVNDEQDQVQEDHTLVARGHVLSNDDGKGLSVTTAGTFVGTYGTLIKADGSYTYTLNNPSSAVRSLAQGQTATGTFAYTMVDKHGGKASSQLVVSGTGTNDIATNDVATVSSESQAVSEGNTAGALTTSGQLTIAYADEGEAQVVAQSNEQDTYGGVW